MTTPTPSPGYTILGVERLAYVSLPPGAAIWWIVRYHVEGEVHSRTFFLETSDPTEAMIRQAIEADIARTAASLPQPSP